MPLIITPRQLALRADLYHQLGAMMSAGLGLIAAIQSVSSSPAFRSFRKQLDQVLGLVENGSTFTDALSSLRAQWVPGFDSALLHAGEQSGRLDICFRLLSKHYEDRARLARQVIADLAYPAFIVHFAILIFPTGWLTKLVWQGDVVGYITAKCAIFVPLYLGIFSAILVGQTNKGKRWRSVLEPILGMVPILGKARHDLALARLSIALESLITAGISIVEAWPMAAAASGSPALCRVVQSFTPHVQAGQTPAEAIRESRQFPDLFTGLYNTGEISGQLDSTLRRLHDHYQEEGLRKMHLVAQWTPRLVYFAVLLLIGYQVLSFWTGYFNQIESLTQ